MGSEASDWWQMQTSLPFDFLTFVNGRWQRWELFWLKGAKRWCLQTVLEGEKNISH